MKTALTGFPPRLAGFAATAPGSGVTYDPTTSGSPETTVQDELDRLETLITGTAIAIEDEGTPLTAAATSIDFVGAGVTATAVGDDVTVTIPGTPTGAASGDLAGTYPNPTVTDDSHSHTAATAPGSGSDMHGHVDNVVFSGDGSTTAFTLPVAPADATSVAVYVTAARSQDWTLSGALLDTLTFGSAPPAAADNIVIDITAALV